jgi:hypothetical protein
MANDKVYIHELIDVIGHNRPKYMHQMTAMWAPVRRAHQQLCLGVWAEVGTTGNWPRTINMWEHDGWEGLAFHLGLETSGKTVAQDSALADFEPQQAVWWSAAAEFRRGGRDRVLVPTSWTRTVEQLLADRVRGGLYAHERIWTPPGRSVEYLDLLGEIGLAAYAEHGLVNIGAYDNALINERECFGIWAIPDWRTWASFEQAWRSSSSLIEFRRRSSGLVERFERRLMTDAPLNPMVIGRQPEESDRRPMSDFEPVA